MWKVLLVYELKQGRKLSKILNSQLLQNSTLKLLLLKFSAVFYFKYNLLYIYMCIFVFICMCSCLCTWMCWHAHLCFMHKDKVMAFVFLHQHCTWFLRKEFCLDPQLRWKWESPKDIPASAPKRHKCQRQAWDAQLTGVLSNELQSSWFQSKHLWPMNPLSPARFTKWISLIIEIIKIESSGKNNISDFHCILLKYLEYCIVM